ncbi:MAG TPA: hypothetical protein VM940_02500 [Chthoniobacterales bacterium]|jgi:hypothetical protein|nr:hypothetical protein [Chthoniobacterales bacterium]
MRSILLSVALLFVAASNLHATEALIFDEGGYNLYILVGSLDKPVIAQVRYTPPGATEWIHVPREQLKIEKFDMGKQVLLMRFSNKEKKPDLPPSFTLSVKKKKAVLSINGKQIKSSFDWLDEVGTEK